MGEVYAATSIDDERRVAVKLLSTRLADADRIRFLREGQLAASIDHPNSIYVFGSEEIDGTPSSSWSYSPACCGAVPW